jgi:hypothetical protein
MAACVALGGIFDSYGYDTIEPYCAAPTRRFARSSAHLRHTGASLPYVGIIEHAKREKTLKYLPSRKT